MMVKLDNLWREIWKLLLTIIWNVVDYVIGSYLSKVVKKKIRITIMQNYCLSRHIILHLNCYFQTGNKNYHYLLFPKSFISFDKRPKETLKPKILFQSVNNIQYIKKSEDTNHPTPNLKQF